VLWAVWVGLMQRPRESIIRASRLGRRRDAEHSRAAIFSSHAVQCDYLVQCRIGDCWLCFL